MGFAVVAGEVRNLAQRCAQAAKDTAGLIEESIAGSNRGKATLDQVAAAMQSATEGAARLGSLVDEVKAGSEEQARRVDEMSKSILQMETVTQSTAACAQQSAAAAEELNAQSESLKGIVHRLTSMVGGERSSRE
jgi:methyl-accepting chemotaxis protein/methyl-accepting chemotaxis protein-1 (serine sensor receptor)